MKPAPTAARHVHPGANKENEDRASPHRCTAMVTSSHDSAILQRHFFHGFIATIETLSVFFADMRFHKHARACKSSKRCVEQDNHPSGWCPNSDKSLSTSVHPRFLPLSRVKNFARSWGTSGGF